MPLINQTVLMSGADHFEEGDYEAINPLMDSSIPVDIQAAMAEHKSIRQALEAAGIKVTQVPPPVDCQDGVYTANWGLVRGGKVIMSRLPNRRKLEEPYALEIVKKLGLEPLVLPDHVERFSGQGDALPCGEMVFTQSPYRTTKEAHPFLRDWLGFKAVIALETKPERWFNFGPAKTNKVTKWPDSPTYDIDLAIAILKWPAKDQKALIAYCPKVFKRSSRKLLRQLDSVDKIEVSWREAMKAFALNLVSTGETVIMNSGAPVFQANLEAHGLKTVALDLPELRKGGGSIRCSTLTLDN